MRFDSVRRTAVALLMAGLAATATACGESVGPPPRPTLTLTPATAEVVVGGQRALTATIQNGSGSESLIWRSDDPAVALVSPAGVVSGVAVGVTHVHVMLQQDTTVRRHADITVVAAPVNVQPPDTMGVLGHGAVTERYTGEVAVRGDWAYTSTWGNRNGRPGNAIKIWNVAGNVPVLTDSLIITGAQTTGDVQISDDGGCSSWRRSSAPAPS
jgi:hypothetical protein